MNKKIFKLFPFIRGCRINSVCHEMDLGNVTEPNNTIDATYIEYPPENAPVPKRDK